MSRPFVVLVLVLLATGSLASCGGDGDGEKSSAAAPAAQPQGTTGQDEAGATGATGDDPAAAESPSKSRQRKRGNDGDDRATGNRDDAAGQQTAASPGTGAGKRPARKGKTKQKADDGHLSLEEQKRLLRRVGPQLKKNQRDACRTIGVELLARQYGSPSLEPKDVARVYARAFVKKAPQFPYEPIYEGCLEGLTGK